MMLNDNELEAICQHLWPNRLTNHPASANKNIDQIRGYAIPLLVQMSLTGNGATIAVLRTTIRHGAFIRLSLVDDW